ncbi:MAG TPA: hypothetical protein VG028_17905 [Terriglobia bacterium]|nr:hypothetical protein [Terriglobia bacterium]
MEHFTWKTAVVLHGKFVAAVVCVLLAIALASCKHNESGSSLGSSPGKSGQLEAGEGISVGGGNSYAHVTYKPEVKVLEVGQVDSSLQGISSDGHAFVFKNADAQIRALKAGDLLFIKNQLVRKVLAAQTDGDQTVLFTNPAVLTDVVQEGDIQIDVPLSFHGPKQTSEVLPYAPSFMDIFEEPAFAQSGADIARSQGTQDAAQKAVGNIVGSVFSGWTVTKYTFVPGPNELDFSLVMTKSTEGFVAKVAMSGFITNFNFVSTLGVHSGSAGKVFAGVKNMTGKLQFDWEIGKGTPGVWAVEDRVKLPGGINIPLGPLLGGMPLTLDVSSALLIHPALTGGNEYSKGGFTINWTGGANFQFQRSGAVSGDSTIQMQFGVTEDTNISPIAPNAMVISYCAPRIELRLDAFGKYATSLSKFASSIDKIASAAAALLPSSVTEAIGQSPLGKVTASTILASNADVFVQFVTTEGVTHSANQTPFPCSKQEIKLLAQGGGDADLLGLTKGATKTADLFTRTFTRWDPASDFCKKI